MPRRSRAVPGSLGKTEDKPVTQPVTLLTAGSVYSSYLLQYMAGTVNTTSISNPAAVLVSDTRVGGLGGLSK